MPREAPALHLQNTLAFVWDFDKTISAKYMQEPLFKAYGIDANQFWAEVGQLVAAYKEQGIRAHKDTIYLNHFLTYLHDGRFEGLTNARLRELGAEIELCPGMPDFLQRMKDLVAANPRYAAHGVTVEHYVVSTGMTEMVRGSAVAPHLTDIWASEFVEDPLRPGGVPENSTSLGRLTQVAYPMTGVGKTQALFEISKGVGVVPGVEVNTLLHPRDYRIRMDDMIYIADGPSDTQPFRVIADKGGLAYAVYVDEHNFAGVRQLMDERRVHAMGRADYRPGSDTDLWLTDSMFRIADGICDRRETAMRSFRPPASHTSAQLGQVAPPPPAGRPGTAGLGTAALGTAALGTAGSATAGPAPEPPVAGGGSTRRAPQAAML